MRPRRMAAENGVPGARRARPRWRFNEAAAHGRGKRMRPVWFVPGRAGLQ